MTTPGTTSGSYTFGIANDQVVLEAFDRINLRPTQLDRHHFNSARTSLNLELVRWSSRGINLWKMTSGTITLVPGQSTYLLPTSLIAVTEMWLRTVDTTGKGNDTDRFLAPITREQYAMIPTKNLSGTPSQYWFQRVLPPQVTFWSPPLLGSPALVCNWFGMLQIQDAGIGGGETPDIHYQGFDALCAGLALRLARKFAPQLAEALAMEAKAAWDDFAANDQEAGSIIIRPNLAGYGRI